MRDHFDVGNVAIAVVTFAAPELLAGHRAELDLPFPVLADVDRVTYRRFGMDRAPLRSLYGPATVRRYGQLLRQGRRLRRPEQDTRQLGGDVVIDAAGRLSAVWRQSSPADRPSIDELAGAARGAR